MVFSELALIENETGLDFSEPHAALFGEKRGFGITVSDEDNLYIIKLFCTKPFEREKEIFPVISELGESLPKNTMMSQSCEYGHIRMSLDKFSLLQENVVHLIDFLDKLTKAAEELGLSGEPANLPKPLKSETPEELPKGAVKIKLGFDMRSILGFIGALIGAAAVTVIAIAAIDAKTEIDTFGLSFEISTYIVSAIATAVIFMDYRFLARKLDAFGVITSPVLAVLSVLVSGFGAGIKAIGKLENISFIAALKDFPIYIAKEEYAEVDKFITGYITRGILLAAAASIAFCVFYFSRHPEETEKSEKIITAEDSKSKK